LTTGAAGFTRPGIQALLSAHLMPADRRQVPAGYDSPEPLGPARRGPVGEDGEDEIAQVDPWR
jgi:hypothetical protein